MTPTLTLFPLLTVLLAAAGGPAGGIARLLLRRLRRGARIPPPWCEVGVAVAWGATGAAVGAGLVPLRWLPVLLGLGWLMVAAGAVDLLVRRLPDALTLPALPVGLLLLVPLGPVTVLRGLAGAAVAVAAHAAVHLVAPSSMGAGDVKLAAPLGAVLAAASWDALLTGAVLAALLTGGLAAAALLSRAVARTTSVPHGPSMLLTGWVVAVAAAGSSGRGP
jgi:leader peptidase (prepilin peptidase)/N-methyltransferase